MLVIGNLDEKMVASCVFVTFIRIKRTHRLCGVGVIDDFGVPFVPSCIIYVVPFDKVGGRSKASVYPSNSTSIGRLERYKEAWLLLKTGHKTGYKQEKNRRNVGITKVMVPRRGLEPPRGCPH